MGGVSAAPSQARFGTTLPSVGAAPGPTPGLNPSPWTDPQGIAPALLLSSAGLASGVTGVTLRLLLGLHCRLAGGKFFRLAGEPRGLCCLRLVFQPLLFGPGGLALEASLLTTGSCRLALLSPLHDFGIVRSGLRAEFIQDASARPLCGLLPIGKSRFLESSHGDVVTLQLVFGQVCSVRAACAVKQFSHEG